MSQTPSCLCILIVLIISCTPPSQSPKQAPKIISNLQLLDDPYPDAPRLIRFREIRFLYQPPPPDYPQQAKAEGVQGDVLCEVHVNEKGIPTKFVVLFGPELLVQSTSNYFLGCRFSPCLVGGKPTPVRFRFSMPFRMPNGGPYQSIPIYVPN